MINLYNNLEGIYFTTLKINFSLFYNFTNFTRLYYSILIYNNFGLVAQWTRACGYEPLRQGFESLLAQS